MSHHGRNVFSATEWPRTSVTKLAPKVAMYVDLSGNEVFMLKLESYDMYHQTFCLLFKYLPQSVDTHQ